MKNKTLQRVLCFCLALCFCFSIAIEPIQAHAVAVELGWVTWALVSYLAASGFAFAVTGGIQALQSEVEQQVDEYYTVTGIDLFQLIAQSLKMRPPNGGGLGNGFWFGAAAVAAIADFIDWVRNNGWTAGDDLENTQNLRYLSGFYNGTYQSIELSEATFISNDSYSIDIAHFGDLFTQSNMLNKNKFSSDIVAVIHPSDNNYFVCYSLATETYSYTDTYYPYWVYVLERNSDYLAPNSAGSLLCYSSNLEAETNIPYFTQFTYSYVNGSIYLCGFHSVEEKWLTLIKLSNRPLISTSTSVVTSPTEVTEFDVQENQYVEIDFSIFENETTFEEPEQLAEAVKNQLIDTGTVPTIITQIKTEPTPTPQPTPAPTPVVPLPENPTYDDIDGLGLPSLGDALLDKFPFCLPSDLGRVIDIFMVERQTPVWEVDLYEMLGDRIPFAGDTALSIDLTEYEELGAISRWITTIGFCLFLLLITRQMITW